MQMEVRPQSALRKLFLDNDGLRGIWAAIVFYGSLTCLEWLCSQLLHLAVVRHLIHSWSGMSGLTPHFLVVLELLHAVAALVATAIVGRLQRRRWTSYGLGYGPELGQSKSRALRNLAYGGLCGFGCFTALIAILWAIHAIAFDGLLLVAGAAVRDGTLWICAMLLLSLSEESSTRCCLVVTLGQSLSYWGGAVVAALWFAQIHSSNSGENPLGLLNVFVFSLLASWSFYRTGTLFWAIGFHATWDWAQPFLFGTIGSGVKFQYGLMASHPIGKPLLSGGGTGPEGSILVLPILAVAAVLVLVMKPGSFIMKKTESRIIH
jgi:uncharacterized protein